MFLWKKYFVAKSIPEVLDKLDEGARLIAGGTDLLLEMQQGIQPPVETLVDVCNLQELNALEIRGEELFIGAAVPLNKIVVSTDVKENAQALVEACSLIGGPQVRNSATLGGNVAHALPAADGTIALLALNAYAETINKKGLRRTGIEDLFLGPRQSKIESDQELLVGFYLPLQKKAQASAFNRVMRPQGVALPILNMAVWLERDKDRIIDAHIALGPSGPRPFRARNAEKCLISGRYDPTLVEDVYEIMLAEVHLRTSPQRATADYRKHLARFLLQEVIETAWERAIN